MKHLARLAPIASLFATTALADELPVTGLPIPELSSVDDAVLAVMETEDITGCTVGISRNGRVIYQRGFGWRDEHKTEPQPENATMRLASTSKAIVAQMIDDLIADGSLDGDRPVFDLGQAGGGILDISPWPSLEDNRMADITSRHLRDMEVNWERDYAWDSIVIYEEMGFDPETDPPPLGIEDIARYALGQEMVLDPGVDSDNWPAGFVPPYRDEDSYPYSNFNYNVLVLVIEKITGQSFLTYLREQVLTPDMWVPASDLYFALPFDPIGLREPHYFSDATRRNEYDPEWPLAPFPYGGFNVEAMIGSSFIVTSAGPLLTYMDTYTRRWTGNMAGSSAIVKDSMNDPAVDIVVLCNDTTDGTDFEDIAAVQIAEAIENLLGEGGLTWPSRRIDGQWVNWPGPQPPAGVGSYDEPYNSVYLALIHSTSGTKLQFHPGEHPFSGTLNKKLRLKAPLGTARIGSSGH